MDGNGFVSCVRENEIKDSQMKGVHVKGRAILLIRKNDQVFGLHNCCPHMGCSLEKGILRENLIMCPCHGWKFDIRTGENVENPEIKLLTYPCKIQNGRIYIKIQERV